MNILSIKNSISRNLSNIPGWRTSRRLVVIESDDWGSIRMPSVDVFVRLISLGIDLNSDEGARFNKNDSLATEEDLSSLFGLLSSYRDSTGRCMVITPISVVANPDFEKIEESGFSEYFYEPFTVTLTRYPNCENSFSLWKEGIEKRLFMPQFHGREHLNVSVWMRALKAGHKNTKIAFNNRFWGITTAGDPGINLEFQAAFDFIDPEDLKYQREVIRSGLDLFEELHGYRATYFVPPNGPFSSRLEHVCVRSGIKYMAASKIQKEPIGQGKTRKYFHWLGQKSGSGLILLTRNCFFEPSQPGTDWVDSCLYDISNAFKWNKPAVISSHRVNFIGALNKANRDLGLSQLSLLFERIMKTWPDTEFVTSMELGRIISNDRDTDRS